MTKQEFEEIEKIAIDKIKLCLSAIDVYSTSPVDLRVSKTIDNLVNTLYTMSILVNEESEDKSE